MWIKKPNIINIDIILSLLPIVLKSIANEIIKFITITAWYIINFVSRTELDLASSKPAWSKDTSCAGCPPEEKGVIALNIACTHGTLIMF